MEMLTSGTITGAGSFRCLGCDYVLTLIGSETLTDCPHCGGEDFAAPSVPRRADRPRRSRIRSADHARKTGRAGLRT